MSAITDTVKQFVDNTLDLFVDIRGPAAISAASLAMGIGGPALVGGVEALSTVSADLVEQLETAYSSLPGVLSVASGFVITSAMAAGYKLAQYRDRRRKERDDDRLWDVTMQNRRDNRGPFIGG